MRPCPPAVSWAAGSAGLGRCVCLKTDCRRRIVAAAADTAPGECQAVVVSWVPACVDRDRRVVRHTVLLSPLENVIDMHIVGSVPALVVAVMRADARTSPCQLVLQPFRLEKGVGPIGRASVCTGICSPGLWEPFGASSVSWVGDRMAVAHFTVQGLLKVVVCGAAPSRSGEWDCVATAEVDTCAAAAHATPLEVVHRVLLGPDGMTVYVATVRVLMAVDMRARVVLWRVDMRDLFCRAWCLHSPPFRTVVLGVDNGRPRLTATTVFAFECMDTEVVVNTSTGTVEAGPDPCCQKSTPGDDFVPDPRGRLLGVGTVQNRPVWLFDDTRLVIVPDAWALRKSWCRATGAL